MHEHRRARGGVGRIVRFGGYGGDQQEEGEQEQQDHHSADQGVEACRQLQAVRAHEAGVGEHFPGGAVGDDLAVVEHQ